MFMFMYRHNLYNKLYKYIYIEYHIFKIIISITLIINLMTRLKNHRYSTEILAQDVA